MTRKLAGVRACVFDAYGTLFNVHAPVAEMAERIGPDADAVSKLWRLKQLEYTWLRSLMQAHAPFWQVTGEALDYALGAHGIDDKGLHDDLMQLYLHLAAYPDAVACLKALKQAGFTTGILSKLAELDVTPSRSDMIQLSMLAGVALTWDMDPKTLLSLQQNYATEPAPDMPQPRLPTPDLERHAEDMEARSEKLAELD